MEIKENKAITDKVQVANEKEVYIRFSYYCDAAAWLRTFENYWADETIIIVQSMEMWNKFYHE